MTEKNIHPEDQVDLRGVRSILLDLLRAFFESWAFIGFCFRKNKFFITLFFVLGMVAGYVYYATKPSQYEATMIVQFNKLTKRTYSEMLEQLNNFIATEPKTRLARELQLSENTAGKLLFVSGRDMDDRYLGSDTSTKINLPFKIVAGMQDNLDFAMDSLQVGILNYLNYSPYLKRVREEEEKINRYKLGAIERDLAKLDSLKTEYNHFLAFSKVPATFYNNSVNPAEFYAQSTALLSQRETTLKELEINKLPLAVVDGFKLSHSPRQTSIPKVVLLFGAVAALFSFLISFTSETRRRVMKPAPSIPTQAQN